MIPLTRPYIPDETEEVVKLTLKSAHLQGGGEFSKRCENRLFEILQKGKIKMTPSCTSALDLTSLLIDLKQHDEVIMPSYNFTSAAVAVANYGAVPVFVDIDCDTKCIQVDQIEKQITSKTRAISWVNYGGFTPDLLTLKKISEKYGLFLIEDNAHALGSTYRGIKLGNLSDFSVLSFHATKNFHCGEGGAIQINSKEFWERAEYMVEKGTNRYDYEIGKENKYSWVEKGGSFLNSEICSAILICQLDLFEDIQRRRLEIYMQYLAELKDFVLERGFNGSFLEVDPQHAAHLFFLELNSLSQRNDFISAMKLQGITTAFHYQALHNSKGGSRYGRSTGDYAVSSKTAENLVRLPLYFDLKDSEVEYIIESTKNILSEICKSNKRTKLSHQL